MYQQVLPNMRHGMILPRLTDQFIPKTQLGKLILLYIVCPHITKGLPHLDLYIVLLLASKYYQSTLVVDRTVPVSLDRPLALGGLYLDPLGLPIVKVQHIIKGQLVEAAEHEDLVTALCESGPDPDGRPPCVLLNGPVTLHLLEDLGFDLGRGVAA